MELNFKLKIKASPEIIYSALVSENGLKSWMSKDASVGINEGDTHYMVFQKEGNLRAVNFRIIELIQNQKVVWSCLYSDNHIWPGTVITFEVGDDESLSFVHRGFQEELAGSESYEFLQKSWKYFLNNLKDYCETGEAHPW